MKRLFFSVFALVFCGVAAVSADDNVRAAQARLKEGGFYFNEPTGTYDSETAAAVSRYQIRNGLQITGQLDAETSKSLGVTPAPSGAPAQRGDSESWRRMRKTDPQFLSRMNADAKSRPQAEPARSKSAAMPPAAVPPPNGAGTENEFQTFTLSRERLRDYVGAFVLAGLDPQVGAELEFFADRVNYYNQGVVDREKIRRDLQTYNARWPLRRFWLAGEVNVEPQADSRLRVTFPLRYELRNGGKRSAGKVRKTLLLEVTTDDLQIVSVNERKL
jgi:peptidoglycan hydrolase-like protein with peptidoglycan-binding domain